MLPWLVLEDVSTWTCLLEPTQKPSHHGFYQEQITFLMPGAEHSATVAQAMPYL
jgi:hypothetical protein